MCDDVNRDPMSNLSWCGGYMLVIPSLWRLRQEDCPWVWVQTGLHSEFKSSLNYAASSCPKTQKRAKKKKCNSCLWRTTEALDLRQKWEKAFFQLFYSGSQVPVLRRVVWKQLCLLWSTTFSQFKDIMTEFLGFFKGKWPPSYQNSLICSLYVSTHRFSSFIILYLPY